MSQISLRGYTVRHCAPLCCTFAQMIDERLHVEDPRCGMRMLTDASAACRRLQTRQRPLQMRLRRHGREVKNPDVGHQQASCSSRHRDSSSCPRTSSRSGRCIDVAINTIAALLGASIQMAAELSSASRNPSASRTRFFFVFLTRSLSAFPDSTDRQCQLSRSCPRP